MQAIRPKAKSITTHLQKQAELYGVITTKRDKYMNARTDEINKLVGVFTTTRDAVNQINTTINKLPESIRQQYGGTGLTRGPETAMHCRASSQYAEYTELPQYQLPKRIDGLQRVSKPCNERVNNVAAGNYKTQEDTTNILQGIWNTLLGQRNSAYSQYQQDENALANIYGARDNWELKPAKDGP